MYCVCFSPDGKYIVLSGISQEHYKEEMSVGVWDWEKQKEIKELIGHTTYVNSVCFSPDGKYIVSGSHDMTVRVWDWEKQMQIVKLNTEEVIWSCALSNNNRQIVAGGSSGQILMYDVENLPVEKKGFFSRLFGK